jgi:putative ABC transport system ATP-binding protein
MVTHEPDMAAYARRMVHFVDGSLSRDVVNANPTLAAPAGLTVTEST